MENNQDNTRKLEPKPFEKPGKKLSQTEIRLGYLSNKLDQLIRYLAEQEQQMAMSKIRETAAILEIYDNIYKDCPKIKELDLSKENQKDFVSSLGFYYKRISDNQMIKLIPIEEGWKLKAITPEDKEADPIVYIAEYEFIGIAPTADYPMTYTIKTDNPNSLIVKLRDYLKSISTNNIIV